MRINTQKCNKEPFTGYRLVCRSTPHVFCLEPITSPKGTWKREEQPPPPNTDKKIEHQSQPWKQCPGKRATEWTGHTPNWEAVFLALCWFLSNSGITDSWSFVANIKFEKNLLVFQKLQNKNRDWKVRRLGGKRRKAERNLEPHTRFFFSQKSIELIQRLWAAISIAFFPEMSKNLNLPDP